jgi:hypothetical protein
MERNIADMTTPTLPKVPIEYVMGKINSDKGSGKAYLFHSPGTTSLRSGEKETYLSTAMQECPQLGTNGNSFKLPARRNIRPEIGGDIFQKMSSLAEGEIFKIFAQSSALGSSWNSRARTACQFIRLRQDAPLHKLLIKVPGCITDSMFDNWFVRGRFDILTLEQAEVEGVSVPEGVRDHFLTLPVEALFGVEIMEPERKAIPKVEVKKVGDRVMAVTRIRRSLKLD